MLEFKQMLKGYDELLSTLDQLPDRVQNRVFRLAGRKASKQVAEQAKRNSPRRHKDGKDGLGHLADRFTFVQRVYRSANKTVFVIGSASGKKNRINHLVEFGTGQRWTGHKTRTIRQGAGHFIKKRRVKNAAGQWKTVTEVVSKSRRISVGSIRKQNYDGSPARMSYRGYMPAFHQLGNAWKSVAVESIVVEQVRAGLQRIADKSGSTS